MPPREPGDSTWRNHPDFGDLVQGDDESCEMPRGEGEPRSGMNHRDRRRDARKHLRSSYNAEPPPKSYNAEPHDYE